MSARRKTKKGGTAASRKANNAADIRDAMLFDVLSTASDQDMEGQLLTIDLYRKSMPTFEKTHCPVAICGHVSEEHDPHWHLPNEDNGGKEKWDG